MKYTAYEVFTRHHKILQNGHCSSRLSSAATPIPSLIITFNVVLSKNHIINPVQFNFLAIPLICVDKLGAVHAGVNESGCGHVMESNDIFSTDRP